MRFTDVRDYNTMLHFNREIINNIVDTPVVIYKIALGKTKANLYGESDKKVYEQGVNVHCLIRNANNTVVSDAGLINAAQPCAFAFLRTELEQRGVYPESGDIIWHNNLFYEINNTTETQLYAGQTRYNHEIYCDAHLTQTNPTQLQRVV